MFIKLHILSLNKRFFQYTQNLEISIDKQKLIDIKVTEHGVNTKNDPTRGKQNHIMYQVTHD
jgi:hypothetical protein